MTPVDSLSNITHVAYSDESHHNFGHFRSLTIVSLKLGDSLSLNKELLALLQESNVSEFKWKKLDSAQYRFAAIKMLTSTVRMACAGKIRIDSLTWDIEDRRHKIANRDDNENLKRMYYHLFKDVLRKRWPDESIWLLYPDENTGIDWDNMGYFLDKIDTEIEVKNDLLTMGKYEVWFKEKFKVRRISEGKSHEEPIIQLADLFAGLSVYSREKFDNYKQWECGKNSQQELFPIEGSDIKLSRADNFRCEVISKFDSLCKSKRLGVSLKSNLGFKTYDPKNPINFWWYVPQHDMDKAPVRNKK